MIVAADAARGPALATISRQAADLMTIHYVTSASGMSASAIAGPEVGYAYAWPPMPLLFVEARQFRPGLGEVPGGRAGLLIWSDQVRDPDVTGWRSWKGTGAGHRRRSRV